MTGQSKKNQSDSKTNPTDPSTMAGLPQKIRQQIPKAVVDGGEFFRAFNSLILFCPTDDAISIGCKINVLVGLGAAVEHVSLVAAWEKEQAILVDGCKSNISIGSLS